MNDKLVLDNTKLIYYVLKKLGIYHKVNEYYDLGLIGLVKAANTFDSNKKYRFSTYAIQCITNEILQDLRKNEKIIYENNIKIVSLDNAYNEKLDYIDLVGSDYNLEEETIKKETLNEIYNILNNLNIKEKTLINMYFGLNGYKKYKQDEISKIYNISQSEVSRIIKKGIINIRKTFKNV